MAHAQGQRPHPGTPRPRKDCPVKTRVRVGCRVWAVAMLSVVVVLGWKRGGLGECPGAVDGAAEAEVDKPP